ncbi:TRAP transporter substrate-binding protein [Marinomonas foliarum]|jgi:TRAP-type transport system periplasmic protein|uniref:Tripartite ATP-independent transporter DctP family solute receptor n=1 Tax=Marinomonas foliarum TaxID=491950 RepID=A0A369AIK3_9GAMM|nr:TRAP transporter substrate-binding protein [Marinomonas foliarum]RCX07254.1 tripartite ATP-independent transporter DctP family solute receptor [Marinomonas foliarum]
MFTRKTLAALTITSALAVTPAAFAAKMITVANFFPDTHPNSIALKDTFKKDVESLSNGELKVKVFSNGVLGAEEKLYNSVRGGTISMAILGTIMDKEVENVGIIQLPFLFKNYEHAQTVLNSDIGQKLVNDMDTNTGMHFLAYGVQGFRVVASNREISSMEDFKGLRLRFPGITSMLEIGNNLGANITPLPISEVFSALEQGVVDGVENPYPNIVASKWYEIVKYITETNHVFTPNLYLMNNKTWNGLSKEQQKAVSTAAQNAAKQEWSLLIKQEAQNKAKLEQDGVKITVPNQDFHTALIQAEQSAYESFYKSHPEARDIVQEIIALGEK